MGEVLPKIIAELYEMNLTLLDMAAKEEWDLLVEIAAGYMLKKQDIMEVSADELSAAERENLKMVLKQMVENEGEITRKLQARLHVLKQNLSSIHRGNTLSKLYSRQQTSSIH
ncbi:flagellar protein FliT [Kosakonia oryzae]|uniref:Flagellar protein FliT n=1 Tax=Kosakonia oryzae TaxID=497725 RepID=A0AA94KQP7_9ENTR|nr:flagellar protein FliT [Kosakonia oryzae]ANI81726.1 flagellar protein FliT [Kosakonia oryzae]UDJ83651.1 flagellar protein FliT [Kosakonia oryzae]SFC75479.1 flagellar protein FliT [Kosakonia oryzae]